MHDVIRHQEGLTTITGPYRTASAAIDAILADASARGRRIGRTPDARTYVAGRDGVNDTLYRVIRVGEE